VLMKKFVRAGYAMALILLIAFSCQVASAKEKKGETKSSFAAAEISWQKDKKLTWDDFRGAVPRNAEEQTAAATFCGIGFETNTITNNNSNLKIRVYNTFYLNNSWARPEEMNDDVLAHEQGHFDLCELYTRKLRERMSEVKVDVNTLKPMLRKIYEQLQEEYKNRQEAYEEETAHGINLNEQQRWKRILERELTDTEQWSES